MKIAYFAGTVRKGDGTVRVLLEMIEQATRCGMECMVVSGYIDDNVPLKVTFVKIPSVPFPFYQDYYLSYSNEKNLEKKLDAFNPDILHVHSPDLISWAALKYARTKKIPILATHHTDFVKYTSYYHASYLAPVIKTMLKALYNRMGAVTTPSLPMAKELTSYGVKNIEITPWGTDLCLFTPEAFSPDWRQKIAGIDSTKKIILSVSRLTWEKDLQVLADTYKMLAKHRNDFILVVAGDGPIRQELEELMPGAVFLGHLSCKELATAYASSDIFLFPSCTETFGNVTLEAMASGLVSVTADEGGSLSLVQDGVNGLQAKARNAGDFYKKISYLLDNPAARDELRNNALTFSAGYSWKAACDRTFAIYDRLVSECSYPVRRFRTPKLDRSKSSSAK
jgi:phosphatidylinositol alpha 1,6-mannosyltransferase